MATPFDGIGGLLGIDPAQLQQLMAQFAPSEDDRKAANMQALAQLGFGLLGTRKGYEWDQVGNAAQNALQARQGALQGAQQGKADQFKMAQGLAKYKGEQDAAKRKQGVNETLANLFKGGNFPADMPTRQEVEESIVAQGPQGRTSKPKWQIYEEAAQIALANEDVPRAKAYAEMADANRPKLKDQKTLTQNGQRVVVNTYADGTTQVLPDLGPDAEKLHFANTGGMAGVGLDPFSGAQVSQGLPVTMDAAQADASKRGWANYGLAKNADQRAAAAAKNGADGPAWVNDLERGLQIDPRSGQTRPIMANGAPVGAKGATKQADQSKVALTIIKEAKDIIDKSTGSYAGAGIDQAARVFGLSTSGAEAAGQLQALEGALMLNQPRMEGPQGVLDVQLYKQMAAKIGDPTIPGPIKKAALATVEKLHKKYSASTPPADQQNDPLGLR